MIIRGRRGGLGSTELRALEDQRRDERAEIMRTSPSAIRRAMTASAPPPAPGEGWDSVRLRTEVEEQFRDVGARVWREDGGRQ